MIRLLFHWTPRRNVPRILARGLRPRSSRWNEARRRPYANRTYFTTNATHSQAMRPVLEREDVMLAGRTRPDAYVLLVIDPAKVPGLRLYIDPEHPRSSVFTTVRIPPVAIRVHKTPVSRPRPSRCPQEGRKRT